MSLKHKRQSKRYEKTTLTQQFWRKGIFRIPSSKNQRLGSGYSLFQVSVVFFMKTKMAINEICRNYPEMAVLEGSSLQDPFVEKSRKGIYKYYLGELVCRISGRYYCFSFIENNFDNQEDMKKLHKLSLIAFFVLGSYALQVKGNRGDI